MSHLQRQQQQQQQQQQQNEEIQNPMMKIKCPIQGEGSDSTHSTQPNRHNMPTSFIAIYCARNETDPLPLPSCIYFWTFEMLT